MPVASGQQLLHFRLAEPLGEGGMGLVWRARDLVLGRDVAIKILPDAFVSDADRLSRFAREAALLASIEHPNIVTIHSFEQDGGTRFITMELVRGTTLESLVRPGGMELPRLVEIAAGICAGLEEAHARGIVHGDLKPSNVMITEQGRVKIVDFGLARRQPLPSSLASSDVTTRSALRSEEISGTLPYMSPEHLQAQPLDARSDIFSLGVLVYEMATGRRPFEAATATGTIAAILRDTPKPLSFHRPDLPRHLDRILGRCLEKEPSRRVPAAADLGREMGSLLRGTAGADGGAAPTIAVLPFVDMSPGKDQDYFCEGIADEIISSLSRVPDIRVVSRTSSFQFKNTALDVREIGDRLGAGVILEGGVRKAGDRIRITADLVGVADGIPLWSERYDRDLKDVFAIQDEIAQSLVEALKVSLSPRVRRAIKQVATSDVEAYEYYLRGRQYFHLYGRRGNEFALQMFRRAIEKDPSYARAHAGIADCCSFLYMNSEHEEVHRACADSASLRALELDPDLAEAHVARGVALSLRERDEDAEQAFQNAVRLNPRLFEAHYFYARHCFSRGRHEDAIRFYEEASRARPEDYQSPLLSAQIYEDLGRSEEAAEARRRGVELASRRLDLKPDDVRALYMGANGLVALGETERGLEWARLARRHEPNDPMLLYNLACIYAMAGNPGEALDCLDEAVSHGFAFRGWLERDSNLDALRDHPRFKTLVSKMP